ncbi:hypothetical protein DE146DRAFT_765462 [Phaeosphaeria sp. MPI-PUGE-AT-0046c]|nr:hypothetical protein DE146DRAFT_765462 [Phaeosphaeria sp. MPI-PUGE-AT-0046c]
MADKENEKLWQKHRRTIEREFVQKGRRLEDVVAYMTTYHQFTRRQVCQNQYGRQLRKWGIRKKLSKAEWTAIILFIGDLALSSGEVEVLWNQVPLLPEQIEREMKRYGPEIAQKCRQQSYPLPKHIKIRPRLTVSVGHGARGLQMVRTPITHSRSVFPQYTMSQDLTCRDIETFTIPSNCGLGRKTPLFHVSFDAPFSWLQNIESSWLPPSNAHLQHLITLSEPSEMQLSTAFYPEQHAFKNTMSYRIASLLNNMLHVSRDDPEELHIWLKTIQETASVQMIEALPIAVFEAFRERLFTLALTTGNADVVTAMLEFNANPQEPIMAHSRGLSPMYPLRYAIWTGHFEVAKVLLRHMLRRADESLVNELFCQIVEGRRNRSPESKHLTDSEFKELACSLLKAGAIPFYRCGNLFGSNYSFIGWMESSRVGLAPWLEWALCGYHISVENLRYLLTERLEHLRGERSDLETILSRGLRSALTWKDEPRIAIILSAMISPSCRDDNEYTLSESVEVAYRRACNDGDWASAASLLVTEPMERVNTTPKIERSWLKSELMAWATNEVRVEALLAERKLEDLAQEKYKDLVGDIPLAEYEGCYEPNAVFRRALKLRHPRVAVVLHVCTRYDYDYFFILLETADALLCSDFLSRIPAWRPVLEAVAEQNETGDLAAIAHRYQIDFVPDDLYFTIGECNIYQQGYLRVLGYHAFAKDDRRLFKNLLQLGLDMDEFHWGEEAHQTVLQKTWSMHGDLCRRAAAPEGYGILPSMLAVVAEHDNWAWIDYLFNEGANMRDSMALLRAVEVGAKAETIGRLLQAAKGQKHPTIKVYGSAALRQALRSRQLGIASMLCKEVEIDGIESSTREWLDGVYAATPLGEAIVLNNVKRVSWLLEHGADPDAYIATSGTRLTVEKGRCFMPLMTPLLAAINTQKIPIVELLVENGATIDDARKSGLTRTPLQRAAELGNFNIVKYFIDQHALIDTSPAYSGGTALQLAAMSGHVGIATLLLERGADSNHLPARGHGRTAFEAAVEWGHFDMVSLLMNSGVDLDLRVGDPLETQYERARRFAEKNGQYASKRNAERIYAQVQAHRRAAETPSQIGDVEEIWSPGPMAEPTW